MTRETMSMASYAEEEADVDSKPEAKAKPDRLENKLPSIAIIGKIKDHQEHRARLPASASLHRQVVTLSTTINVYRAEPVSLGGGRCRAGDHHGPMRELSYNASAEPTISGDEGVMKQTQSQSSTPSSRRHSQTTYRARRLIWSRKPRNISQTWWAMLAAITPLLLAPIAQAEVLDRAADAVIGQANMQENFPNQPDLLPTDNNLALSNAADISIAPDGRIYVADADNNRVLSWPSAVGFVNGEAADLVLGQPNFTSNAGNHGGVSASSLFLPQGLSVDAWGNLWVADAFNNRVLQYISPADTDTVADLVIGQPDFVSTDGNLGGFETGVKADSLLFPGRVVAVGQDIYIADSGNSRVLHYSNPTTNKPSADLVLGQFDNFTTRAQNNDGAGVTCRDSGGMDIPCGTPSAESLFNAIGLAVDSGGNVYVADWMNHRVLRFDRPLLTDSMADAVYGQADLSGNIANHGGPVAGLTLPISLAVDAFDRLLVADSANNRVVVYRDPLNNTLPGFVFGQLDSLSDIAVNHGLGVLSTDEAGLFGPTGIAVDALNNVYIADTNNSRVLRFDLPLPSEFPGDLDVDTDIDLDDWALLTFCADQPAGELAPPDCRFATLDDVAGITLADYAMFQRCLTGAGTRGSRDCAN